MLNKHIMEEKQKTTEGEKKPAAARAAFAPRSSSPRTFGPSGAGERRGGRPGAGPRGGNRPGGRGGDKRGGDRFRTERVKPEYDQKSIDVRRVARVVAGGRRFSFSVAMIIGDRKGKVGVGTGKAGDISMAMEKAVKDAKKHMITVKLTKNSSIPHDVKAKSSSATVEIIPAPSHGLIAGSAVRNTLALAGITDVNAKILSGSKNKLNMARATIKALEMLKPRTRVQAEKRAEEVVAIAK